ncbi:MAG TPA: hypothetical protein VMH80_09065 [Bryobacteraceae bacterium]|nr:hypothetical protein [Bryobacteraceae bacterium]
MKESIKTGSHEPYLWLTSAEQYISTLVQLCPEVAIGRYLAVTSIDSGTPWLTDQQASAGWQRRSGLVYSPRLATTDELFYQRDGLDCPGYDEWYLFDNGAPDLGERITENPFEEAHAPRPGRLMVFVGYPAFVLHDPDEQTLANMFWRQLEWVRPESYVADGRDHLTFVSRNAALFDTVYERLKAALSP